LRSPIKAAAGAKPSPQSAIHSAERQAQKLSRSIEPAEYAAPENRTPPNSASLQPTGHTTQTQRCRKHPISPRIYNIIPIPGSKALSRWRRPERCVSSFSERGARVRSSVRVAGMGCVTPGLDRVWRRGSTNVQSPKNRTANIRLENPKVGPCLRWQWCVCESSVCCMAVPYLPAPEHRDGGVTRSLACVVASEKNQVLDATDTRERDRAVTFKDALGNAVRQCCYVARAGEVRA
jgi:hypothetical protein